MNRVLKHAPWFSLVTLAAIFATPVQSADSRFECGAEALLEEGACVLSLFDIDVIVSSSGSGSINTLSIRLGDADTYANDEVDGVVYRAEIGDLNGDGRPEVFAYVSSAGSGSYGSLVAYVIDDNLQLNPITLQELGADDAVSSGYMGHDEFAVVEDSLVRRFPLYDSGDVNAAPTAGTRNVVYKLHDTEDGWALTVARVNNY